MRGAAATVGRGLVHWWPSWTTSYVLRELWQWIRGADLDKAAAAIDAALAGPLPQTYALRLPGALRRALQRLIAPSDFGAQWRLMGTILRIEQTGAGYHVRSLLEPLVQDPGDVAIAAAAALAPHCTPQRAAELSAQAAMRWPPVGPQRDRLAAPIAALVPLNPDAWLARARVVALAGPVTLDALLQLADIGPRELRKRMEPLVTRAIEGAWPLPWIYRSTGKAMALARPDDLAQLLIYRLGAPACS